MGFAMYSKLYVLQVILGYFMTTFDAMRFGGAKKLTDVLGLTRDAIYKWGEYPPNETQYKISVLSGGRLADRR